MNDETNEKFEQAVLTVLGDKAGNLRAITSHVARTHNGMARPAVKRETQRALQRLKGCGVLRCNKGRWSRPPQWMEQSIRNNLSPSAFMKNMMYKLDRMSE